MVLQRVARPPYDSPMKGMLIAFGAVLFAVFAGLLLVGIFANPHHQSDARDNQRDAIDTCQDLAKKTLKDPDSARFSDWTTQPGTPPAGMAYSPSSGDVYYLARGMVNGKNSFGAYDGDEPYACDTIVTTKTVRAQPRA